MNRLGGALLLVVALSCAAGAEGGAASFGAGATATAGSGGYSKISLYADGLWHAKNVDPYGWAELSSDNFLRQFTLGGGVWKDLQGDLRVKGGGGIIFGRLKDSGASSGNSLLLETAIEKDFESSLAGAGYDLVSGSIAGPTEPRAAEEQAGRRARGAASLASGQAEPERLTYNELSGYAKLLLGKATPGFSLTLGLPSYARSVITETLNCKLRVSQPLSITPAVSFEEGTTSNVYLSIGLYYLF